MEIRVEGSVDQAMRALKRKLAREGVFKEWKKRAFYEKPSRAPQTQTCRSSTPPQEGASPASPVDLIHRPMLQMARAGR